MTTSFGSAFSEFLVIDDPRATNRVHPLESVLFIVVVGVLCGGDGFVQIEAIANARRSFIEKYVALPAGIPTHDTLARVFQALDPTQFRDAFCGFIAKVTGQPKDDVIQIDGKTLRGALNRKHEQNAKAEDQVHMVSAYSKARGVVLAQLRSSAVANENQAARDLLQLLDVTKSIVTMDAAHCQASTIDLAVARGADVVVGLKNNQRKLLQAVTELCESTAPSTVVETDEKSRGRHEVRKYAVFDARPATTGGKFAALRSAARVTRTTTHADGTTTTSSSFYMSTLQDPTVLARSIRDRWGIENSLHYCLDVAFDEDGCRVRVGNAAENLSRVRHLALSLLKLAGGASVGLATRRILAAADDEYLRGVLRLAS